MSALLRALFTVLAACAVSPAFAVAQCPAESVKPGSFVVLGYGVLAVAFGSGLAVLLATWRRTRTLRPGMRGLCLLGACVVMLGAWLAGLMIWLGAFVLPC